MSQEVVTRLRVNAEKDGNNQTTPQEELQASPIPANHRNCPGAGLQESTRESWDNAGGERKGEKFACKPAL
jgi:hypothetical protein